MPSLQSPSSWPSLTSLPHEALNSKTSISLDQVVVPTRSRVFQPAQCSRYISVTPRVNDPCPTALNSIAEAIDRLGKLGTAVQPVFIDMDPKRAALVSIPACMEAFGPSFLGLTGSTDDVERAAKSFKVRLERIQLSHDSNDYVMKHASPIFVMRPSDPHPTPLPATSSPEAIAANLRAAL